MTDSERYDALRRAVMGVIACFKSRTESSTCIEDHHPSCQDYIASVLAKLDEDREGSNNRETFKCSNE